MPGYFFKLFLSRPSQPFIIIFVSFVLSGCGYHAGIHPQSVFPSVTAEHLSEQRLVIPLFSNATLEPLLERKMTQIFKEALSRRGWHIEENKNRAKLSLSGRITSFGLTPISLSLLGAAREYRIRIGLEVRLLRTEDGKALRVLLLQGLAEYSAQPDAGRDRIAKDRAIREAGQKMAEEIALLLRMPTEKKEAGTVKKETGAVRE